MSAILGLCIRPYTQVYCWLPYGLPAVKGTPPAEVGHSTVRDVSMDSFESVVGDRRTVADHSGRCASSTCHTGRLGRRRRRDDGKGQDDEQVQVAHEDGHR